MTALEVLARAGLATLWTAAVSVLVWTIARDVAASRARAAILEDAFPSAGDGLADLVENRILGRPDDFEDVRGRGGVGDE